MYLAFSFILGTLIGSFLNVVIYRIPKNESIAFPASHCPTCHHPLKPWHNIPLLSWIFLQAKCAYCKAPISVQYPLIELASGLLFSISYLEFGYTIDTLLYAFVFDILLALSIIDWRYKAVPDSLNLLAFLLALFVHFTVLNNLINALVFAGGFTMLRFFLSYYMYKKFNYLEQRNKPAIWRKNYNSLPTQFEAMGEADIIIVGTIAALLGIELTLFAVFLSALLTIPVALLRYKTDKQTPFIPFLAIATLITFIYYQPILAFIGGLYA